ncbi:hypothetical protein [Prochlorococcus marinus]|uniref:hypothetical protein n=1 Tax=Prochlorococcus marinus TaxID=1219 RepID=UPI0022B5630A|nr:hypothetical protein [Prochlorococcus marinus]
MAKEKKKFKNKLKYKKKFIYIYSLLKATSMLISTIALVAISLQVKSMNNESKSYNNSVEEILFKN